MSRSSNKGLFAILFIAAIVGWLAALFMFIALLPTAGISDGDMTKIVSGYIDARIKFTASGAQQPVLVEPYLSGPARNTLEQEVAARPPSIPGLTLSGQPTISLIWRAGQGALAEARYAVMSGASTDQIDELLLLTFSSTDQRWTISGIWRPPVARAAPIVAPAVTNEYLPSPSQ